LNYRGEQFAEVWFKPEGNPLALTFRIPQSSFQLPGMNQRLTIENLLRAVGLTSEEVDSWRAESASAPDPKRPLSPPSPEVAHLTLHVSVKPPAQAVVSNERLAREIPEATWQFLEERWGLILGLEAAVDNLRMNMEGLRSELEATSRKALTLEVKNHALSADLVQWGKAKSRIHYAVPKLREFIQRAIWALATPERKKLTEIYETNVQPRVPLPQIEELMVQFEGLLKDRQVLYALGMAACQECKNIAAECQTVLRTLHSNAAANASRKGATGYKGKNFRA
jgi:hypothetical protein